MSQNSEHKHDWKWVSIQIVDSVIGEEVLYHSHYRCTECPHRLTVVTTDSTPRDMNED